MTAVRAFIDDIEEITEVDQTFLDNATAQWQIGRAVPLPKVTSRGRADPGFLPAKIPGCFFDTPSTTHPVLPSSTRGQRRRAAIAALPGRQRSAPQSPTPGRSPDRLRQPADRSAPTLEPLNHRGKYAA